MIERFVRGITLAEAYNEALIDLSCYGHKSDCLDWNCKQLDLSMTIEVEKPLVEPMISRCFIGGPEDLEQYRQEMLDGILDFEVEKGNWSYTYHSRMTNYFVDKSNWGDQVRFVINELKRNPSSRRAVIDVRNNNEDMYSNDPACLQHIQYLVRDGKLECKVLFRSNDACKAAFMNMFALIMLQKKIADALGLEVGSYTHRANSFHCYERDFDLLKGYVERIQTGNVDNLCYDYEGDWDELMEDARESIAKKVESLRG